MGSRRAIRRSASSFQATVAPVSQNFGAPPRAAEAAPGLALAAAEAATVLALAAGEVDCSLQAVSRSSGVASAASLVLIGNLLGANHPGPGSGRHGQVSGGAYPPKTVGNP